MRREPILRHAIMKFRSGAKAQRLKIAVELIPGGELSCNGKRHRKRPSRSQPPSDILYIMDAPTTRFHFEDIKKLLAVLHKLVNAGNTLVVVEHNLDVIKSADWIIDLGPEGGAAGGQMVAEGRSEQVAKVVASHAGGFLMDALKPEPLRALGAANERSAAPLMVSHDSFRN
jgi:excinuclease ABC subunit A